MSILPTRQVRPVPSMSQKSADGTLTIDSGSSVGCNNAYVGYNNGVTGDVTVDGLGSQLWSTSNSSVYVGYSGVGTLSARNAGSVGASNVYVGYSGTGTLDARNTGIVTTLSANIGYAGGSTGAVTIDGAGSTWTNYGILYVGYGGSAMLNITNAGTVRTGMMATSPHGFTAIGYGPGSTGGMTVDGAGSSWVTDGELNVAGSGTGTLTISNGGTVTANDATYVWPELRFDGNDQFRRQRWNADHRITIGITERIDGVGTINCHGMLSDIDLVFDSTHPLKQTITLNGLSGQNITLNVEATSGPSAGGYQVPVGMAPAP